MAEEQIDPAAKAASDVRHRMANIFQLLSALARMRGQRAPDAETRRQLNWMADGIGSLGALERHRRDGAVDFTGYLQEMAPNWKRRHGANQVALTLDLDPLSTPDSAASTLALVAQELVCNALTHGFPAQRPGSLLVRLKARDDGRWELQVTDDGVGFDPLVPAGRERFGLWFVRSLASQVRGEFTLTSTGGVDARLVFHP